MIMTTRPHPPGDTEAMRNNESHWSGLNGIAILLSGTFLEPSALSVSSISCIEAEIEIAM